MRGIAAQFKYTIIATPVLCAILLSVCCTSCHAQESSQLEPEPNPGLMERLLMPFFGPPHHHRVMHQIFEGSQPDSIFFKANLLMPWRSWAEQPVPYLPAFVFLAFISMASWSIAPGYMTRASMFCREHFWKSLFLGISTLAILPPLIHFLYSSIIAIPLAILLKGLGQLAFLVGLAVMISLIGDRILVNLKLATVPFFTQRRLLLELLELTIGVLFMEALLAIPNIAGLPRIGIRLVLLLAAFGFGGLFGARNYSVNSYQK